MRDCIFIRVLIAFLCLIISQHALAKMTFATGFLNSNTAMNSETFNTLTHEVSGEFFVTLYVNGENKYNARIHFDKGRPLLSKAYLDNIHVSIADSHVFDDRGLLMFDQNQHIRYEFNRPELTLNLFIPQYLLTHKPEQSHVFSQGANLAFTQYSIDHTIDKNQSGEYDSQVFGHGTSGANVHGFYFRSHWSFEDNSASLGDAYIKHVVPSLSSYMTAGKTSIGTEQFDSFSFSGLSLKRDNSMLAGEASYAPIISGNVLSQSAQVTVSQNDTILYRKVLYTGPFVISELNPSSQADLTLTIKEQNGAVYTYSYPVSHLPGLMRPGTFDYEIDAGRTDFNNSTNDLFVLGALSYGFNTFTFKAGSLFSNNYIGGNIGSALTLGEIGTLSFNLNESYAKKVWLDDSNYVFGVSQRIQYAKYFGDDLALKLGALRYNSSHYLSFPQYATQNDENQLKAETYLLIENTWSEALSDSLQFSYDTYYNRDASYKVDANVAYALSHGITLMLSGTVDDQKEASAMLSVNWSLEDSNINVSHISQFSQGSIQSTTGVSNYNQDMAYSANVNTDTKNGKVTSANVNLNTHSKYMSYQMGLMGSEDSYELSNNYSGSVLWYQNHLDFTHISSDSYEIIDIDGLGDHELCASSDEYCSNEHGEIILPGVNPYHANTSKLDYNNLPYAMSVKTINAVVYPERDAVPVFKYKAEYKRPMFVKFTTKDNPTGLSGAKVLAGDGTLLGFVSGQTGTFLNLEYTVDTVNLVSKDDKQYVCQLPPQQGTGSKIERVTSSCLVK
ncbi:fimbria/pilus outer membrane usher protein [Vibrio sp. S4M6]|uniref:fimbria/pilus outer membrane usher protein n=1 Tax=Vibrio sinus TaxID=2946865 RepID=UPI00202A3424|nr:fimbria/pilus outer membrane usher protein [Vibrio sinus]MCL9781616.1 fimbria/pilus outer membrane usher protein [Vibrio sinus]